MAQVGSSGFLGRVNNEEDLFKKRKKNTVDNSVTPESTKSASKAKIASPKITQVKSNADTTNTSKNISVEAYAANDIQSANNALNKALRKSGLIEEEK